MTKCEFCKGDGDTFVLPRGNPFSMKLPLLARAMVKVRCSHCRGEGYVPSPGLNIGTKPWPEGFPTD